MDKSLYIQIAASCAAVAGLAALSSWARLAQPLAPLNEARARRLLCEAFADRPLEQVWVSTDGCGAVGRSGGSALVLYQSGERYAVRRIPWASACNAAVRGGIVTLALGDGAAPATTLALPAWPPHDQAA